jgi:LysM domain
MFASRSSRPLATLVAVLGLLAAFMLGAASPSSGASHPRHHVVRANETLWAIAEAGYPNDDPRASVDRIEHANHLPTPTIAPGQMLLLP